MDITNNNLVFVSSVVTEDAVTVVNVPCAVLYILIGSAPSTFLYVEIIALHLSAGHPSHV